MILTFLRPKPQQVSVSDKADEMCQRSREVRRMVSESLGVAFDEEAHCPACPFDECRIRRRAAGC